MVYPSQTRREFPKALIFITTEASVRFNFLAMVTADTFPRSRSRMTNSLGVHARWFVCMVRPSRCACRFMYHRGKPVTRANARMTRPRWRRPPSECSLKYASCLGTHSYLPLRCRRRSARHLRQYFAAMGGRPFKPSSIMEPHLIHLMETTLRCWTYSQVHFRAAW